MLWHHNFGSYDFISRLGSCLNLENTIKKDKKHFNFTSDKITFDKKLDNDLQNGKNIVLICMAKKLARQYENNFKNKYKTTIYCGDMDDCKKEELNF